MLTPHISLIICTRNHASELRRTIAALREVRVPSGCSAEVLFIDNGSTDETPSLLAAASLSQMPIRTLIEPRAGKSICHNTAIAQTASAILLFTDDDVHPPADWIEKMAAPLLTGDADITVGNVHMAKHLHRPWMTDMHFAWLVHSDLGKCFDPRGFVGANVAIARHCFNRVPLFDPNLGPGGMGFCDDNLLGCQFHAAGLRFRGVDCTVEHHFDPSRLSRASFLDRACRQGQSGAYMAYHWMHRPCFLPLFRAALWKTVLTLGRIRYFFHPAGHEGCPQWELRFAEKLGYALQYDRERRTSRRYTKNGLAPVALSTRYSAD